jgi:hypothetical protein
MLKAAVQSAIDQIRHAFPDAIVTVEEDGDGGAYVIVDPVSLSPTYETTATWIGFRITFQYPHADVYPHFVRPDLRRVNGQPLGDGMSTGQTFLGRQAIQISRRSNHLNPATDTALLKLQKVLAWLDSRP